MSIKDIFNEYLLFGFDEVKKYKSLLKISEEKLSNLLVDYYLNELCVEEKQRVINIIKTFKVDDVVKNKIFE